MLQYRTNAGDRRKPAIGRFGELTVEQDRSIAQDWLADVRRAKTQAPKKQQRATLRAKPKNQPRTVESNQGHIDRHIVPNLGTLKVREVT